MKILIIYEHTAVQCTGQIDKNNEMVQYLVNDLNNTEQAIR